MESSSPQHSGPTPAKASADLTAVRQAQDRVAARIAAPCWYHVGVGVSTAILFASFDLPGEYVTYGVVAGGLLLPVLLMWLVKRTTGVGVDRYRVPVGGAYFYALFMVAFILLLSLGLFAKFGLGVPWAMLAAGVLLLVPAVLVSYWMDEGYQRELRGA